MSLTCWEETEYRYSDSDTTVSNCWVEVQLDLVTSPSRAAKCLPYGHFKLRISSGPAWATGSWFGGTRVSWQSLAEMTSQVFFTRIYKQGQLVTVMMSVMPWWDHHAHCSCRVQTPWSNKSKAFLLSVEKLDMQPWKKLSRHAAGEAVKQQLTLNNMNCMCLAKWTVISHHSDFPSSFFSD